MRTAHLPLFVSDEVNVPAPVRGGHRGEVRICLGLSKLVSIVPFLPLLMQRIRAILSAISAPTT